MRTSRRFSPLTWRLCLALLAGAALIRESLMSSAPALGPDAGASPPATKPVEASQASQSAPATYTAIAAHPVFEPSRQPWAPPAVHLTDQTAPVVQAALVPPRGYMLVGIVTTQHQQWALLRDPFGKTIFVTEGRVMTGWTVHKIDDRGVHFEAGAAHFDLSFPPSRNPAMIRQ